MTTGKILKLMVYLNKLSDCLKNPINFSGKMKSNAINVKPNTATEYRNLTTWDGSNTYIGDNEDDIRLSTISITATIQKLSGDVNAEVSLRAEYGVCDDEHKNPEYKFHIGIDDECFTVDKNGWC